MFSFTGKRILITQNSLYKIAGSEVNTLELARYFTSKGASVTVYTLFALSPMVDYFDNIKVVVGDEIDLKFEDFDLIWVHQQILPGSLLREIPQAKTIPPIIFFYMSSSVNIELPYTPGLEEYLASKALYVSQEALNFHLPYRPKNNIVEYTLFPNPAPPDFLNLKRANVDDSSTEISRILVVSNHPPQELIEAIDILRARNITVTFRGESTQGTPSLITPEELSQYDCVVTIGKTVQYCLVQNIPVYIYDHFGGPGYLSEKDFSKAEERNFSGRGFAKMDPEQIADGIISGFHPAQKFQSKNSEQFENQFSIESVLSEVLKDVNPKTPLHIDEWQYLHFQLMHQLIKESVTNQNNASALLSIKNNEYNQHLEEISHLQAIEEEYKLFQQDSQLPLRVGKVVIRNPIFRAARKIVLGFSKKLKS